MPIYEVKVSGKRRIIVTGMSWAKLKALYRKEGKRLELLKVWEKEVGKNGRDRV